MSNISDLLGKNSLIKTPVSLEMYTDTADPWGMSNAELSALGHDPVPFSLMTPAEAMEFCAVGAPISPVRIVEDGDIYTAVEALYKCGSTRAALEYRIYKAEPYTDIRVRLEFADKNKLVRLKVPVPEHLLGSAVGDGPYVWEKKPEIGEITFQKWVGMLSSDGKIYSVINDSTYAGKVEDGAIHLTLVRGAGYCFHPIYDRQLYPEDRYLPRIDSGRYNYNFRIYRGTAFEVTRAAEEFNQPPYAVNVVQTGA